MRTPTSPSAEPDSNQDVETTTAPPEASQSDLALSAQLDSLLESYLELLDTYTTLCEQLSKDFSSGFFSIAQANRSSTLGPGRRYGEENYDERMKALRRVTLIPQKLPQDDSTDETEKEEEKDKVEQEEDSIEDYHFELTHVNQSARPPNSNPARTDVKSSPPTASASLPDPLTWFGILTPPALRAAQNTFVKATTTTVPSLVNTITDMARVERRIWEVRRNLGILDQYEKAVHISVEEESVSAKSLPTAVIDMSKDLSDGYPEAVSVTEGQKLPPFRKGLISPPASPPPVMKTLVSRPSTASQPRSRVLKLE